jgi:ATP-dependent phosphoenolpyruvate carboxykinase
LIILSDAKTLSLINLKISDKNHMLGKRLYAANRMFSTLTKECSQHLKSLGIIDTIEKVHNPTVAELYEYALSNDHLESCDHSIRRTSISDTGALSCSSGSRTGRSPKDKRIVIDDSTRELIHWGKVNIPLEPHSF